MIYGGAVLALVAAGLFLRGMDLQVGDAQVTGRYDPLPGSRSLRDLTLSWHGLSLRFSPSSSPGLAGFDDAAGASDILLDTGARLRLTPGTDPGGSLTITAIAGQQKAGQLVVPFSVAGVLLQSPPGATLSWRSAGKTFLLTLPAAARVDSDAGTLSLPVGAAPWTGVLSEGGITAAAATVQQDSASRRSAAGTLPDERSLPGTEDLRAAIGVWLDKAWQGWSADRFAARDETWSLPDGTRGISDDIGVSLLAEAVARGSWTTWLPVWVDAVARHPSAAGNGATSAFVGGTAGFARALSARTASVLAQVDSVSAGSGSVVLQTSGLVTLVLDHGSPDLLDTVLSFITTRKAASLSAPDALGLLDALVDAAVNVGMTDSVRAALRELIGRRILAGVRSGDGGLFWDGASGEVDVVASARCGVLLVRAGAALGDSRASAVGRGMIAAALGLADADGGLPATLRLSGNRIVSRSGSVAAESLYRLLPTGRRVPREVPLPSAGPGVSIWTAADVTASRDGAMLKLILGYPAGVPHYFVIQGLGAFSEVLIHGIPWHADPEFARYPNGWSYDAGARLFNGKLTGRTGQEEIDITS